MFDVGFWELAVIFVIGLLVLGPQRLPQVARQMGQWAGKARRMARMLGDQLQEEIDAVDPRRIMDSPPPASSVASGYSRPGMDDLKPGQRSESAAEPMPEPVPEPVPDPAPVELREDGRP